LARANSNRVERVYPMKSNSRWNRRWGLRVKTREGVWVVSDKTRQPTHVDSEIFQGGEVCEHVLINSRPFKRVALLSLSSSIRIAIIFRIRALL